MSRDSDLLAPASLLYAGCAALVTIPLALLLAVLGQGVGAWLGGCEWIGISVPVDRQVWALVNQPELVFSARRAAVGYWLGSLLLPLLVGATAIPFVPRPKSVAAELVMIQLSWVCLAVGLAWLPLLDGSDGHLARWLSIHQLPQELVWLAPLIAAGGGMIATIRLLAVSQVARTHPSRVLRMTLVLVHLGGPVVVWTVVVSLLQGRLLVAPTVAILMPLMVALGVAFSGYPSPFVHALEDVDLGSFVRVLAAMMVLLAGLWFGGRPVAEDGRSGVLWGTPTAVNNIRPWIAPAPVNRGSLTPTTLDEL